MYTYIYIYTLINKCIYKQILLNIYIKIKLYIYIYVYLYMHIYIYMYMFIMQHISME